MNSWLYPSSTQSQHIHSSRLHLKIPHSPRSSAMLKTQNAPPDQVTVTRFRLRKHEYIIRANVSLVHNEHKKSQIFLEENIFNDRQSIKGRRTFSCCYVLV